MYLYEVLRCAKDRDILYRLERSAAVVAERLRAMDCDALNVSDYTKKYMHGYVRNIRGVLQIYTYLLYLAMKSRDKFDVGGSVFVDYGGGTGIMSLLAREMGFGTVLYVDIYEVSCRDAELIAGVIGAKADRYVCGDIDALCDYVSDSGVVVDILVSYDVIEHIYDIESFFSKIGLLNTGGLVAVCASSANAHNPFIRRRRMRSHRKTERQDRLHEWGHKERDSLRSYLDIRREIISGLVPDLPIDILERMARNTRGLNKDDIEQCVRQYVEAGDFTYRPDHPTNTCDPYTGNWNERLMHFSYLKGVMERNDFAFSCVCGYYGYSLSALRRACKFIFNALITLLGRNGVVVAPYYVLIAENGVRGADSQALEADV